jgi:signal transduction histidine kinase
MLDPVHFSTLRLYIAGYQALLSVAALIVLWVRRRSVLDLWLMVVICAYVIEVCLIAFPVPVRFSAGWYAGRIFGLVSGSLVLFVLLYEITILYAQLLRAVLAQRREREARLMTGDAVAATIAHEIKQPLSGMITNADAGVRWLDRPTPDLDQAKASFKLIVADGHRAGAVIESIRAIFRKDARNKTSLDVNDLIGEALTLTRGDLQRHRILVQAEPNAQLPQVRGDRIDHERDRFDGGQGWGAGPVREVRGPRRRGRDRVGGGYRNRGRPARTRSDIQSAVHYKIGRHGDGAVDLSFDHRGP